MRIVCCGAYIVKFLGRTCERREKYMRDIHDLIIKINTETSILVLGQEYEKGNYISSLKSILPDYQKKIIFPDNIEKKYSEVMDAIIDYCEDEEGQKEELLNNIIQAEKDIDDKRFSLLKSMGWCGVVTSLMNQMPGFSEFRSVLNRLDVKNDYFSRKNPCITYLFGKAGSDKANIPMTFEEKMSVQANKNEFWNRITTRIKMSGVLVIDGWNPLLDWLTLDDLNSLISFPENSVYIFGVTDEMKNIRQVRKLVSKNIVILYEKSLFDSLCEAGYSNFEVARNDEFLEDDEGIDITIDSVFDKAEYSVEHLSYQIINQLDSSISVLDNTIFDNPNYIDREEYFLRFLSTENGIPLWGGYASGFYFARDKDDELLEKVERQLKNTDPAKNKVVVLEGNNSSGKSATLGFLAYRIRCMKKYPVIYITSSMKEKEQYEDLERLIKNHINAKMGARKTVIIWDKNTYGKDEVYENLRRNLEECNIVIVGSRYIVNDKSEESKEKFQVVTLDDYLHEKTELKSLRKVLKSISQKYATNFDIIIKKISNVSNEVRESFNKYRFDSFPDKGNWFLLIFNRLFEELHDIQKRSVGSESSLAQKSFVEYLNDYSGEMYAQETFLKMYEMLGVSKPDNTDTYKDTVSKIFNMIAVAGKYGLQLPAMIVFRTYENLVGNWQNFVQNIKQSSVIRMDLHEDGVMMIHFRRALEASLFLEQQVDNYEKLLELEVDSLLTIIRNTNFYDMDGVDSEALQVVNLIRKFGPNGPEPTKYKKYFYEIAKTINEVNGEINDEAILVASHMVREAFEGDSKNNDENKILLDARNRLRKAINQYGNRSKSQQLIRLKVELSANLLKSISSNGHITTDERNIFCEIESYLESAMEENITRFSAGVFLDAGLRVYNIEDNSRIKAKILSRMLQIVDDINDMKFSVFGENIHDKILMVLSYAKKYDEMEDENKRLIEEGSDVGIYRNAMTILDNYSPVNSPNKNERIRISEAIKVLEENFQIVKNKPRSLYLYIRLLWIQLTGKAPFTEKQFVTLSDTEWQKLSYLCECYINNEESKKKPFPFFVLEMDRFRNGNIRAFKDIVEITREFKNSFSAYITYAVLCAENGDPVKEDIQVKRSSNRRSIFSAIFTNLKYEGVEAHFKDSNFKDIIEIYDGKKIKSALIGFNLYGVVVYGENDLYSQIGGKK